MKKILKTNIRQKPWLIELLPWVGGGTCTALYPYVFLSRAVYKSVFSESPDPYDICRVIHEQEHVHRAKEVGPFYWHLAYIFSREFRFKEEIEACRPQFKYLKAKGLTFNLTKKAQNLSGWLYLWAVSYQEAHTSLSTLWENV